MNAPYLKELKANRNPLLKILILSPISLYLNGNFESCSSLDLEKAKKERMITLLEGNKIPEKMVDILFKIYCNGPNFKDLYLVRENISGIRKAEKL